MIKLGIVMDPISSINIKKDSTFEMMWQAQDLGWELHYFEMQDLSIDNGIALGESRLATVYQDAENWFALDEVKRAKMYIFRVLVYGRLSVCCLWMLVCLSFNLDLHTLLCYRNDVCNSV